MCGTGVEDGSVAAGVELSIEDADLARLTSIVRSGVASKQELKDRIMAAMADINPYPVVHTQSDTLDEAA